MLNKLALLLLLSFSTTAHADEQPKFTILEKSQPAPFAGTLFNPPATAKLLACNEFSLSECDLKVQFELDKLRTKCDLDLKTLQIGYDSLETRHQLMMQIKDDEIERLTAIATNQPNKHNHWWLAGGFVAGTLASIAIFYASTEIAKTP